jgi:hypothetical protein
LAVEGVFYAKNARTTVILGHARGAVLLAATLRDLPVFEYSPAEVKSAVAGTGRATKEQVQYMVQRLLRLRAPRRRPPMPPTASPWRSATARPASPASASAWCRADDQPHPWAHCCAARSALPR